MPGRTRADNSRYRASRSTGAAASRRAVLEFGLDTAWLDVDAFRNCLIGPLPFSPFYDYARPPTPHEAAGNRHIQAIPSRFTATEQVVLRRMERSSGLDVVTLAQRSEACDKNEQATVAF
jgi:hypothetical protein